MLLNHYKKPSIGLCTMEFIKQSYKQILKEELHSCIYILTQRNNLTDQCSVLKLFYLYS